MMIETIVLLLGGAAAGFVLCLLLTRAAKNADKKRDEAAEIVAFERGRAAGSEEERSQLEIRVAPFRSDESEWLGLKKTLTVGYTQQIYYRGLPVGERQTIVTTVEQTWDQERVDRVIGLASDVMTSYVQGLLSQGLKARILKKP